MKKTVSVMSLRSLMTLLVGLLVVVALIFAASALRQSSVVLRNASMLTERNRVADNCLQAIKYFAYERGRTNVILQDVEPISRDYRRFIDEYRSVADIHIGAVLANLPDSMRDRAEAVRQARDVVMSMRPEIERNFALRRDERDSALAGEWLEAANRFVAAMESLLIEISNLTANVDAGFNSLSELRIYTLQFRNLAGLESTLFAGKLASGVWPGFSELGTAHQLRGRSLQVWLSIENGVEKLADPVVSAAALEVRRTLFGTLRPLQDEIVFAAGVGMNSAVALRDYLPASILALDATFDLADATSQAASVYTQRRLTEARWQQAVSLASIAAILILATLVGWLLVRRLTRPLDEILQRIERLLHIQSGDVSLDLAQTGGNEFGVVQQALGKLDETMSARLRSEVMSASILASVPQSVIVTDTNGLIRVFSPGAETMLGYSASEVVGKQTPLLFHDTNEMIARAEMLSREMGVDIEPGFPVFVARTRNSGKPDEYEWTYLRRDGSRMTVLLTTTSLRDAQGRIDGYIGVGTDITERTQAAAKFTRMAHYDHLTGLPNRRLLHDRLQVAISQARREHSRLAMMLVDLDKFKPVNDHHGHSVGDLLLKIVARRMLACVRESDTLARIGGDEFVVVIPGVGSDSDAVRVAEKIRLELNKPFELPGGYSVEIACSIGIAMFPEHGQDEKTLAKNADDAMYIAKEQGRNRVYLLSHGLEGKARAEAGGRDLSFMRMVWQRSYRCGDESIDREHHELFDRANTLIHAAIADEEGGDQLSTALDELIESVQRHFANEEAILASYHYAALDDHRDKHRFLVERALHLRRDAERGELSLGELVTFLSQEIVVKHMLKEDRKFFSLFKQTAGGDETSDLPYQNKA